MIKWDEIDNEYKIFEDPIHGYMNINSFCLQFIDTPQFQRLRHLKQLGTLSYIYNSANHTRFEHSLGVGFLSGKMINKFKNEQPELHITNRDSNLVQLAGLMHDIGHGPFSHVFDGEFIPLVNPNINYSHEKMSQDMIDYLIDDNYIDIESEDISTIKNLIQIPDNSNTNNNYLYQIVANYTNCIDVDKFDYLSRDMYYLFGYSKLHDFGKLYRYNRIIDNQICYNSKIIFDIYELFQQRYKMHKEIYNHKIGKGIEYMICDILYNANNTLKISDCIHSPQKFIKLTDNIIDTIKLLDDKSLNKSKEIIKRLEKRDLYKYIDEYIMSNDLANKIDKIKEIDIISYNNDVNIKLNVEDIIIFDKKINYNLKDKNPVDYVYFYDIKEKNKKYKMNKENISLLLPTIFEERIIRIYSRSNDIKKNQAIANAFKRFIKQFS